MAAAQINDVTESQTWVHKKSENDLLKVDVDGDDQINNKLPLLTDDNEHGDDRSQCSESSEASEIANLADVSILDDVIETKQQEEIMEIIEAAKSMTATSIDLSRRKLQTFPDALLQLSHLEYMYLEGNRMLSLPDDFFKMFPHLRWLDLRNNLLSRIPSAYLSSHTCLRNILLEGNNLCNLPLQLGLVKSLHGLNISGNPLDFPPQEIIERGTQDILNFLKDLFESQGSRMADLDLSLSEKVPEGCEHVSVSSDDWNTSASMMDLAKKREAIFKYKAEHNGNPPDHASAAKLGKLHKSYNSAKTNHQDYENVMKMRGSGIVDRKNQKESKLSWRINPYPSLPTQDYVTFKMNEEQHLAKVKELKEKIDALIQKQKDESMLKKWRDVAKMLQQKKYSRRMQPGKDYEEPGEHAPFGIDADMRKVLSKEDRLKADLQRETELKEQRYVSPTTKMRKEQERQRNIFELEQKIKKHTAAMVERRKQSKGTPQREIEIARRELQIAEQLHSELMAQR